MECLQQQHALTKRQLQFQRQAQTGDVAVPQQRVTELQTYARLLVAFAGTLDVASDVMSKLEAVMV